MIGTGYGETETQETVQDVTTVTAMIEIGTIDVGIGIGITGIGYGIDLVLDYEMSGPEAQEKEMVHLKDVSFFPNLNIYQCHNKLRVEMHNYQQQ